MRLNHLVLHKITFFHFIFFISFAFKLGGRCNLYYILDGKGPTPGPFRVDSSITLERLNLSSVNGLEAYSIWFGTPEAYRSFN